MILGFRTLTVKSWCLLAALGMICMVGQSWATEVDECALGVEWQSIYDSGEGTYLDMAFDLAEDADGNIYSCGITSTYMVVMLWRIEKFSPSGELLWANQWSPNSEVGNSVALRLATTPDNGIVVVGWSNPPLSSITVKKFDEYGNSPWTYTTTGNAYALAYGTAIAVNGAGEIYAAGKDTAGEAILVKLQPNGWPLWVKNTGIYSQLNDLVVAPGGDVIAGGELSGNATVIRFDPDGEVKWIWGGASGPEGYISNLVSDEPRQCFYGVGQMGGTTLVKFMDYPIVSQGNTEWIGSYSEASGTDLAVDEAGDIWVTGRSESIWSIIRFDATTFPSIAPSLECITADYDWTVSHGLRGAKDVEQESSLGQGIVCTQDGGIASCGYVYARYAGAQNSEVVKLVPAALHGNGPGPVAGGNPGAPGPDHPGGLKPGEVLLAGGSNGYVDPKRGEAAKVSVYPTSAGEVVLKVVDRRGSVVKQISAAASGSGPMDLVWDGTDASGDAVAPGIYAVLIKGPGIKKVQKVAVVY